MTIRAASIFFIILILTGSALIAAFVWQDFLNTPLVTNPQGFKYKVRTGSSYKTVSAELHQQQILKYPFMFDWLFRLRGDTHHLKAGEYLFPYGSLPDKMINQMVYGTGMVYHAFTIIPGMNFRQVRELLNKDPELNHITLRWSDDAIMKALGVTHVSPEGRFFPDTYYFVADSADLILLKRAYTAMQQKILKNWESRTPNLPFRNPYEALIAASIIEKEAHNSNELPIIAGVMVNRLRKGILLQFDPTVIYGEGEHYNGIIYKRDLLAADNRYNTYVYKGLPPTPISMPGLKAIEAATHPQKNDYLYFVASGEDGAHQFSATLAEHISAVNSARQRAVGKSVTPKTDN